MLEDADEDFEAAGGGGETSEEVFCNPWALKCHREHLKKMGLLSPTTTTTSSSSLTSDGKAQSPQKMSQNLVNYSKVGVSFKKNPSNRFILFQEFFGFNFKNFIAQHCVCTSRG